LLLTQACIELKNIFSRDIERKPFYFWFFTRTLNIADGSASEPMGIAAKIYIE
jgi:hypothetical protein